MSEEYSYSEDTCAHRIGFCSIFVTVIGIIVGAIVALVVGIITAIVVLVIKFA